MPPLLQKISFVMPVKNAVEYLSDSVGGLQELKVKHWELVIIDDGSTDGSLELANVFSEKDERIIVQRNSKVGKVSALNQGYAAANGEIIKCIDADDKVVEPFSELVPLLETFDAVINHCIVTNAKLEYQSHYRLNPSLVESDLEKVESRLISIPRHSWTFRRDLAEKIFPMPESLPFEDVWFSLVLKKFAKSIGVFDRPCYLYRQHGRQTYGGILNYDSKVIEFRAKRMLQLIDALEVEQEKKSFPNASLGTIKNYYHQLSRRKANYSEILDHRLFLRLVLFKYFRPLLPLFTKLKWKLDDLRLSLQKKGIL